MAVATIPGLESCKTAKQTVVEAEVEDSVLRIPITVFESKTQVVVRPKGWAYNLAVEKTSDGTYQALLLKCTHMDNALKPTKAGFTCTLHGSQFDSLGNVVQGPAGRPLKTFRTKREAQHVIIYLT